MTFTLTSIPSGVTKLKLVIQASEPQGNGITRAYSYDGALKKLNHSQFIGTILGQFYMKRGRQKSRFFGR